MPLTASELRDRRIFDWDCMEATFPGGGGLLLRSWKAYADRSAQISGRTARRSDAPTVYIMDLSVTSLTAPGRTHGSWTVMVDLNHPNYPKEIGWPTVMSRPLPYNPHVSQNSGSFCTGNLWRGPTTLAEFVVRMMRLLNYDERIENTDGGLNRAAKDHWQTKLGGRPLDPKLAYPTPKLPVPASATNPFGPISVTPPRRT